MADVINLGRAKKSKARAKSRALGDQNAAKFGRTAAQRKAEDQQNAKSKRDLDGHLRIDAP